MSIGLVLDCMGEFVLRVLEREAKCRILIEKNEKEPSNFGYRIFKKYTYIATFFFCYVICVCVVDFRCLCRQVEGRFLTGRDKRQLSGVCIEAELIALGWSMDLIALARSL